MTITYVTLNDDIDDAMDDVAGEVDDEDQCVSSGRWRTVFMCRSHHTLHRACMAEK
jgi:hypothetical protein